MINLSELKQSVTEADRRVKTLLIKKNNDYSNDEDVLSNFTKQAIIEATLRVDNKMIVGQIISKIVTKLIRICNILFGNKKPNYESLGDSCDDLQAYNDLLRAEIEGD